MNNRTKVGIAIVTALIIGVGGYFGMNHFSPTPNEQEVKTETVIAEKFGVIESMRIVKAHPKYAEIEALEREIGELQKDVQAKIERGKMMSMPSGLRMEVSQRMTAGEQALFAEANQKIAAKETELNKRLAETELAKRQAASEEMEKQRKQITEEYKMKIFNIKLKLETLKMSDEVRASMEKDMETLQREESAKLGEIYQSLVQKMSQEMTAEQQAASQEMEAYMRQIGEEYGAMVSSKTGQPNDEMMAQINELNRQLEADVTATEKAVAEKRKKQEELQNMIVRDIKMKVARIAREQELTVVFSDVQANITAVDLTDQVIEACKEHWKQ